MTIDLQQYGMLGPAYGQAYMYSYYVGQGVTTTGTVAMQIPEGQPKGWQACLGFLAFEQYKTVAGKLGESVWECVVVK